MLMTRWNPFPELAAMERAVDRLFSEVFGTPVGERLAGEPRFLPVNIEEADGQYRITAPLAGFKPEEIEVTYDRGALTVSAEHREERKREGGGYVRQEIAAGSFYRRIPVGEVDPNSISARLENGILTITMPAPERPEPVRIGISSQSGSQRAESRKQLTAQPA